MFSTTFSLGVEALVAELSPDDPCRSVLALSLAVAPAKQCSSTGRPVVALAARGYHHSWWLVARSSTFPAPRIIFVGGCFFNPAHIFFTRKNCSTSTSPRPKSRPPAASATTRSPFFASPTHTVIVVSPTVAFTIRVGSWSQTYLCFVKSVPTHAPQPSFYRLCVV